MKRAKKLPSKASPSASQHEPPAYPQVPHEITHHGDTRIDPYFYFREKKDARIKKWLDQENQHCEHTLSAMCAAAHQHVQHCAVDENNDDLPRNLSPALFESLESSIYKEMKARWKETDFSLPSKDRNFWYLTRTREGEEHPIYSRIPFKGHEDLVEVFAALLRSDPDAHLPVQAEEQIILDVNSLQAALGVSYLEVGDMDISDDELQMLVTVDLSEGEEIFTILLVDLRDATIAEGSSQGLKDRQHRTAKRQRQKASKDTGKTDNRTSASSHVHNIVLQIEAFPSSSEVLWHTQTSFFYVAMDDTKRPYRVVFHDLLVDDQESEAADVIVFEEKDAQFWVSSLSYTEDEQCIVFCTASKLSEEWWCIDAQCDVRSAIAADPLVARNWSARESPTRSTETSPVAEELYVPTVFRVAHPRTPCLEYELSRLSGYDAEEPGGGAMWLVMSNRGDCQNFVVDYCPVTATAYNTAAGTPMLPSLCDWLPFIAYDNNVKIEHVVASKHFILIGVRRHGFPASYLLPVPAVRLAMRQRRLPISLSDPSVAVEVGELLPPVSAEEAAELAERCDDWRDVLCIEASMGSDDYDCDTVRVYVHHMLFPARVFLVARTKNDDLLAASLRGENGGAGISAQSWFERGSVLRVEHVPGRPIYNAAEYEVRRVWVPTAKASGTLNSTVNLDEVRVPMTIAWYKPLFAPGKNPCLITAYGSYGDSTDPDFSAERLSLLQRGVVYALANVRGGGELGRMWRDAGRLEHRHNTFADFVACSRFLGDMHFCHPRRLCSLGGSAGGTVVATAMQLAPELYTAVLPLVPFVDCLTTMLDPSIPLTTAEWEEWGNPLDDPVAYRTIKAYSPMDNLSMLETASRVPRFVFIESGYGDPRVPHWEPMAFAARLRDCCGAKMTVLHKCNLQAGHGGASGRYEQLKELAREYAFVVAAVYAPPSS